MHRQAKRVVLVTMAGAFCVAAIAGCKTYGGTGQKIPSKPTNIQPQPQPQPQPTGGK